MKTTGKPADCSQYGICHMNVPTSDIDSRQAFSEAIAGTYSRYWSDHSRMMVGVFRKIIRTWGIPVRGLADIACGEGTFVNSLIGEVETLYGVDLSPAMLAVARRKEHERIEILQRGGVAVCQPVVSWQCQDMRELALPEQVDVVTCWFNSLNYLVTEDDLLTTFKAVSAACRPDGYFVFDVYTIRGLEVEWRDTAWVAVDVPDCFVASQTTFDKSHALAEVTFTGFVLQNSLFTRFDETHYNRGYRWVTITSLLRDAGFHVHGKYTIPRLTKPHRDAVRILVVAQKT